MGITGAARGASDVAGNNSSAAETASTAAADVREISTTGRQIATNAGKLVDLGAAPEAVEKRVAQMSGRLLWAPEGPLGVTTSR